MAAHGMQSSISLPTVGAMDLPRSDRVRDSTQRDMMRCDAEPMPMPLLTPEREGMGTCDYF
jgi:hypothetical protein